MNQSFAPSPALAGPGFLARVLQGLRIHGAVTLVTVLLTGTHLWAQTPERTISEGSDSVAISPISERSPSGDDRDNSTPRSWRPSGIDERPVLTNAALVWNLGREGARKTPHRVDFEAVVLLHNGERTFRVQEGESAILVASTNRTVPRKLAPGQRVRVRGVTTPGRLGVRIESGFVESIGDGVLPEPVRLPVGQLVSPKYSGRWTEVEGLVRDLVLETGSTRMVIVVNGRRMNATLPTLPPDNPPFHWIDARARLQGICSINVDNANRPGGAVLIVPETNFVQILTTPAAEAFAQETLPFTDPRLKQASDQRLKVRGTVVFHSPYDNLYLRSPEGPLLARLYLRLAPFDARSILPPRLSRERLQPGEEVEVIGAPSEAAFGPVLLDAEFRRIGRQPEPLAIAASAADALIGRHDLDLVSIEGRVLATELRTLDSERQTILVVQSDGVTFHATCAVPLDQPHVQVEANTRVRVDGICRTRAASPGTSPSFTLWLRSPAELVAFGPAPFWQTIQPGPLIGFSASLGLGALLWIWTLRRQVSRRTKQLQAANAELQGEVEERKRGEVIQRAVYQISAAVHAAEDLKSLYARIHEVVRSVMQAENFFLLLHNPAHDQHEYVYHVDQMDPWPKPRKVTNGLVGHILQTGHSLRVDRPSMTDPNSPWRYVSGTPSAVWLGVPLRVRGETIGVMAVQDYNNPKAYSEDDEKVLTYMAAQTALAIEGKRASDELARFAAIAGVTSDFMGFADMEQRMRFINAAGRRMLGLAPDEPLDGMMVKDLYPVWAYQKITETILPAATRDGAWSGEIAVRRRDGTEVPVSIVGVVPRNHAGQPAFISAVMRDISERKQIETDMERALAHEKELSELKSRFVSMVSHEFRTPLGIIMGSAEILDAYLDRLPASERNANLKDILQSAGHMARLMEEVLLLGRVEAGKMACKRTAVNLAALFGRIVDEARSTAGGRCPIEFQTPADLPEALGDESLLRHIFGNLLSNAVKYSPAGTPVEFIVECRVTDAVFTVRDRGLGIPVDDQRQLFQAFHRGRNVGETQGTGLGMVIVKHCVELHGGRISFESREGLGTTFTVELPLFEQATPSSTPPPPVPIVALGHPDSSKTASPSAASFSTASSSNLPSSA